MELKLKQYQAEFFDSKKRFPALIAGIGTGKTYMMLLKIWHFCQEYPKTLAMIIRREFTDLESSTIKDFERYFDCRVGSNKEYRFDNGSVIMFKHGKEVTPNVLKNYTLDICGIEQSEEFETDQEFTFLRDRMRGTAGPFQQLMLVANACGHNWMWKHWVNNPPSDEYDCTLAQTFDNEDNLPPKFIEDLKHMETEAPNHYNQFVLNSFEELGDSDRLLNTKQVYQSSKLTFNYFGSYGRILSVDVARYGEDETVFCVLEKVSDSHIVQIHQETWRNRSLMETCGKILDMHRSMRFTVIVIDDTGMGGGVTDRLRELKLRIQPFIGSSTPSNPLYYNKRSEGFFLMKELFDRSFLKIIDDPELSEQLLGIKYKYRSTGRGQKAIIGKEELRKEGLKSPDRADALMMGCCYESFLTRKSDMPLEMQAQGNLEFAKAEYDVLK